MENQLILAALESRPLEKKLAAAHKQAMRWRNIARNLLEEQRARTNDERAAIRAEREKEHQENALICITASESV